MFDGGTPVFAVPSEQSGAVGFAPTEKVRISDQAIFDDLGIAGPQLTGIERIQQRGIGDDEQRMVESADQVLLPGGIDCGLAADRAVRLRQQGCGDVDDRAAALEQGSGQSRDVADRSSAKRDDRRAALHIQGRQLGDDIGQGLPILRGFALRHQDGVCQRDVGQQPAVKAVNALVADHWEPLAIGQLFHSRQAVGEVADKHLIVGAGMRDADRGHSPRCCFKASIILSTTSP